MTTIRIAKLRMRRRPRVKHYWKTQAQMHNGPWERTHYPPGWHLVYSYPRVSRRYYMEHWGLFSEASDTTPQAVLTWAKYKLSNRTFVIYKQSKSVFNTHVATLNIPPSVHNVNEAKAWAMAAWRMR